MGDGEEIVPSSKTVFVSIIVMLLNLDTIVNAMLERGW